MKQIELILSNGETKVYNFDNKNSFIRKNVTLINPGDTELGREWTFRCLDTGEEKNDFLTFTEEIIKLILVNNITIEKINIILNSNQYTYEREELSEVYCRDLYEQKDNIETFEFTIKLKE